MTTYISQMPEELQAKVTNFNAFQKAYCEYRAKGFSQAMSAERAGSGAEKQNLARTGFQVETLDGAKEYISFLKSERASTSVLDALEVIKMIKKVYDAALREDKFKDANDSAKLLGMAIGIFDHKNNGVSKGKTDNTEVKNNTDAFREGEEPDDNQTSQRINELHKLMKELNTNK